MMRLKSIFSAIVISSVLFSCATSPLYQSQKLEEGDGPQKSIEEIGWYDSESQLKYCVYHDSSNLFLKLVFLDPMATISLKSGGLIIYFDPKGKYKKDQGLCFPVKGESRTKNLKRESAEREQWGPKDNKTIFDPARIIQLLPENAIWKNGGKEQVFRWRIEKEPCRLMLKMNKLRQLEYHVQVPLDLIFAPDQDRNKLALGLECKPEVSKSPTTGNGPAVSNGSVGRRGSGGGRMGGGRRAPAGMKGVRNSSKGASLKSALRPINFWFRVKF